MSICDTNNNIDHDDSNILRCVGMKHANNRQRQRTQQQQHEQRLRRLCCVPVGVVGCLASVMMAGMRLVPVLPVLLVPVVVGSISPRNKIQRQVPVLPVLLLLLLQLLSVWNQPSPSCTIYTTPVVAKEAVVVVVVEAFTTGLPRILPDRIKQQQKQYYHHSIFGVSRQQQQQIEPDNALIDHSEKSCSSSSSHHPHQQQPPNIATCSICYESFASRNALFRHVRTMHTDNDTNSSIENIKYTLAIWFGYNQYISPQNAGEMIQHAIVSYCRNNNNDTRSNERPNNNIIQSQTQVSVAKSRPICLNQESNCASAEDMIIVKVQPQQQQLVRRPSTTPTIPASDSIIPQRRLLLQQLSQYIQEYISTFIKTTKLDNNVLLRLHGIRILDATDDGNTILNINNNSTTHYASYKYYKKMHAEQSCTQHVYHAVIPLSYMPNSSHDEIRHWFHTSYYETNRTLRQPIPKAIRTLKSIFRSMESTEIQRTLFKDHNLEQQQSSPKDVGTTDIEVIARQPSITGSSSVDLHQQQQHAKGRFGALAYRIPQYWHNYGNPQLRLSPNYEPVRRVIDRARIIDFIALPNDGNIYIICSIIGDELLQQQVRRMVATAIAMVHNNDDDDDLFLPSNFLEYSINPNHIVDTPVLPAHLVYRAQSRFHWHEQHNNGQRIFDFSHVKQLQNNNHDDSDVDHNIYITAPQDPIQWMQSTVVLADQSSQQQQQHDHHERWMTELREVICPRIRQQMVLLDNSTPTAATIAQAAMTPNIPQEQQTKWHRDLILRLTPPPPEYEPVLTILQSIVMNHLWPTTSAARSSVIRTTSLRTSTDVSCTPPTTTNTAGGSFTVVNSKIRNESNGCNTSPKANELFPDLSQAVFELEQYIIENNDNLMRASFVVDHKTESNDCDCAANSDDSCPSRRLPSTHCAINCNAQFKPHVDSGRGLGQSVSMIVGLGNYIDGEIVVEHDSYPIRYQPLEFDGWKLRHWTQPFIGADRFTLVWFTPATTK